MILKKLYTSPKLLFKPVEFVNGINYIFGKKEPPPPGEPVKSLNGIGKSLLLDLINFCLLSDYNKIATPRLILAYNKGILKDISIVLEFEIAGYLYTLSRSFEQPAKIFFSKKGSPFIEYNIKEVKPLLCDLIFERIDYEGTYNQKWLRNLLLFFLKIQTPARAPFVSPIKYILESSEAELNPLHFFFLNLDNSLLVTNFEKATELKQINASITKVNKLLIEIYGSKLSKDIISKKNKLKTDIDRLNSAIKSFRLSEKYKIDEDAADEITAAIKNLWITNSNDEQKIRSLNESLQVNTSIKVNPVSLLYQEINELLGKNIKKTLEEAIEFRKNLVHSRKEFIESEVSRLKNKISERDKEVSDLENKRSEILKLLQNKKAFTDLRDAYVELSSKQSELNDLTSRYKIIEDLTKKKIGIKKSIDKISDDIYQFVTILTDQGLPISSIITDIYDNLYPGHSDTSIFDLIPNPKLKSKLKIDVLENAEMLSHGMNQGRTLIYDLAILFFAIINRLKLPRFLIHDGILDGMDKTHFIELVKYLKKREKNGDKFQYIITLNEEGTLKENFQDGDLVNPKKIEQEAIMVLTPYKKLFNMDF